MRASSRSSSASTSRIRAWASNLPMNPTGRFASRRLSAKRYAAFPKTHFTGNLSEGLANDSMMDSDPVVECPTCARPLEEGLLLASSHTYWSNTERLPLFRREVLQGSVVPRGQYYARPLSIQAWRCSRCSTCSIGRELGCVHDYENGWLFPQTSLRWVRADNFIPSFWWPFVPHGKDGSTPEVLVAGGFRLTMSSRRRRATRCRKCQGVVLRYRDAGSSSAA